MIKVSLGITHKRERERERDHRYLTWKLVCEFSCHDFRKVLSSRKKNGCIWEVGRDAAGEVNQVRKMLRPLCGPNLNER